MSDGTDTVGIRAALSRGFYGFRPYGAVQIPLSQVNDYNDPNNVADYLGTIIPFNVVLGGEYNIYMRRFTLTPYAGIGIGYIHVVAFA